MLVMIVDDHTVIRRMVRAMLEAESFIVIDGAEAVQKAQTEKPDLIILDLSISVMNGLEAARELKTLMPRVPLLMFTNNAGAAMEKDAREAGIFAVISKSDVNASRLLMDQAKTLLGLNGPQVRRVS